MPDDECPNNPGLKVPLSPSLPSTFTCGGGESVSATMAPGSRSATGAKKQKRSCADVRGGRGGRATDDGGRTPPMCASQKQTHLEQQRDQEKQEKVYLSEVADSVRALMRVRRGAREEKDVGVRHQERDRHLRVRAPARIKPNQRQKLAAHWRAASERGRVPPQAFRAPAPDRAGRHDGDE